MAEETTRIVWEDEFEAYRCEKCGRMLWGPVDFLYCPFCGVKIEGVLMPDGDF